MKLLGGQATKPSPASARPSSHGVTSRSFPSRLHKATPERPRPPHGPLARTEVAPTRATRGEASASSSGEPKAIDLAPEFKQVLGKIRDEGRTGLLRQTAFQALRVAFFPVGTVGAAGLGGLVGMALTFEAVVTATRDQVERRSPSEQARRMAQIAGLALGAIPGIPAAACAGVISVLVGGAAYIEPAADEINRNNKEIAKQLKENARVETRLEAMEKQEASTVESFAKALVSEPEILERAAAALLSLSRDRPAQTRAMAVVAARLLETARKELDTCTALSQCLTECALVLVQAPTADGAGARLNRVALRNTDAVRELARYGSSARELRWFTDATLVSAGILLPLLLSPALGTNHPRELQDAAQRLFDAALDPTSLQLRMGARDIPDATVAAIGAALNLSVVGIDFLRKFTSREGVEPGAALWPVGKMLFQSNATARLSELKKMEDRYPGLAAALKEPPSPEILEGTRDSAGLLGAQAARVPGGIAPLRAAHSLISVMAEDEANSTPTATLEAIAAHRRADLYATALFPEKSHRKKDSGPNEIDRALDAFQRWRAQAGTVGNGSSSTAQREASVALASLGLALLETETADAFIQDIPRPMDFADTLNALVGRKEVAKHGPLRSELMLALFNLAAAFRSLPREETRRCLDALAQAFGGLEGLAPHNARNAAKELCQRLSSLEHSIASKWCVGAKDLALIKERLGDRPEVTALSRYLHRQIVYQSRGENAGTTVGIVRALAEGRLASARAETLRDGRIESLLPNVDERRLEAAFTDWEAGASSRRGRGMQAFDSGHVLDWVEAVDSIPSCQRTSGSVSLNKGLMTRFLDGSVRLLAVRGADGKLRARAVARLAALGDGARPELGLFVNRVFVEKSADEKLDGLVAREAMIAHAQARAAEIGARAAFTPEWIHYLKKTKTTPLELPEEIAPDYREHEGEDAWITG